jgi:riboflavin kinase / FMN adenylyltransferase
MKLARSIEDIPFDKNSIVTVGTFDGVHLAHQKIIGKVVDLAKRLNGRSVVVTFEPHPREVLDTANMDIKLLTTSQERQDLCEQLGVDWLLVIEFSKEFSQQGFRDFYLKHLIDGIGISVVVEGYDHHWGRNREGNIEALVQLGKEYEFEVVPIEQFRHNGVPVNSSMIRSELLNGSVEVVTGFLGRPYALFGKVVLGDQRGRSLGYPTANVELTSQKKIVPKNGIYFVQVRIAESKYFGMASIGVRPTFYTDGKCILEVHILDFSQNIYGCNLRIDFLQRLRDEWKFDSVDKLIQQMHHDEELSRELQYKYQSLA